MDFNINVASVHISIDMIYQKSELKLGYKNSNKFYIKICIKYECSILIESIILKTNDSFLWKYMYLF
jgi:hypothetical protein